MQVKKSRGINETIGPMSVSLTKTGACFGSELSQKFNTSYIEVYFDYNNKKVGFKPTENNLTGFKLAKKNKVANGKFSINCPYTARATPGRYPVTFADGMYVCDVPELVR